MTGKECGAAHLHRGLREPAVADTGECTDYRHADVRFLCFLHLLHGMSLNHVADFVTERPRQLVEPVSALDQATVYIDVTARQRERVDLLGIDYEKVPIEVGTTGRSRNRFTEVLDVAADRGVGNDRKLRVDVGRVPAAERDLLVLGDRARRKQKNEGCKDAATNHFVFEGVN